MKNNKSILILLDKVFKDCNSDPRVYRTASYFKRQNFKVKLICFDDKALNEKDLIDGIEIHRIIPIEISRPRYQFKTTKNVAKKIISEYDFDIVISNDHMMLNILSVKFSKNILIKKLIFMIHMNFFKITV